MDSRKRKADPLAAYAPDDVVLIARSEAVRRRRLDALIDARIDAIGGGRRLVMIRARNDVETVVNLLACRRAGHVAWLATDCAQATCPLVDRYTPDTVLRGGQVISRAVRPSHDLHPDLGLLMSTSGSTGTPRLVRIASASVDANAAAIALYLGLDHDDVGITSLPLSYCYGLSVLNSHLAVGAPVVITSGSLTDPAFWTAAREAGVTGVAGVPHSFALLERMEWAPMLPSGLRYMTQAGGRMDPARVVRVHQTLRARGADLYVMYGQTEATARIAYLPPEHLLDHPHAVGVAIPGGHLEVEATPDGDGVGELVYRGPNVMMGYAHTADDLARGRDVTALRTGDLARMTPQGLVEITGRLRRVVKPFGLRIDMDACERMLAEQGIEALVAGDDDGLRIVVRDATAVARAHTAMAAWCTLPLRAYRIDHRAAPPTLCNGKPDYTAIAAAPMAMPSPVVAACPVAAAFAEALMLTHVADDDTFVDLGGDSLSYVEVSLALEEAIPRLPDAWPTLTVAELRARIPSGEAPTRQRGRRGRVETSLVLRAVAITLVVAGHMRLHVMPQGGAHLLLALAGFSFARFQLAVRRPLTRLARGLALAAKIAVPTALWVGAQMATVGGYSLGTLLLINNYTGADRHGPDHRWLFWFVEVLVQLLVVVTPLVCLARVDRWRRAHPFAVPLVASVVGLAVAHLSLAVGEPNYLYMTHVVAWLFLLGWAIHEARTIPARLAATLVALGGTLTFFASTDRHVVVSAGLIALIWLPTVHLPGRMVPVVGAVAAASLGIYLTHWEIWPLAQQWLPFVPAWAVTVAGGVLAWRLWTRVEQAAAQGVAILWRRARGHAEGDVSAPAATASAPS